MSWSYAKTGKSASLLLFFLSKMIFCQALNFFTGKGLKISPREILQGNIFLHNPRQFFSELTGMKI